jgi:L-ribulokinase
MMQGLSSRHNYSVGVDFGTNSVRALVVDLADGTEIASVASNYPSGESGILLDPKNHHLARQNPADYLVCFNEAVGQAVEAARGYEGFQPDRILGIGIDATGSTPIPVDRDGTPLAMQPAFRNNLAAQAWLWKDHCGHAEAAEITDLARHSDEDYLAKYGGAYTSESYWAKILHCKRTAPEVFDAAYSWVELADYIPAYLTGNLNPDKLPRGICAAGHKALYNEQWGGLPKPEFLRKLDPDLVRVAEHYAKPALSTDRKAGGLTAPIAQRIGLLPGTAVAVGAIDAHLGAVGAGIRPGTLVKIIGTSACDMMVVPMATPLPDIPGLFGIVPGSIVPGMYALEGGQSAVGDIFNWFVRNLAPSRYTADGDPHINLSIEAERLQAGESGLLALDWNNGNRSILLDPLLSGLLIGQTLHTTAPDIYRALIEATAFGGLTIIRRLEEYGLKVDEVINCGGIAEKSPLVMQIYADVYNRPMKISRSSQTSALGAAIFGAVVGGAFRTVEEAQAAMTGVKAVVYQPQRKAAAVYADLYRQYLALHDAFGTSHFTGALDRVMKELTAIRESSVGLGR